MRFIGLFTLLLLGCGQTVTHTKKVEVVLTPRCNPPIEVVKCYYNVWYGVRFCYVVNREVHKITRVEEGVLKEFKEKCSELCEQQ